MSKRNRVLKASVFLLAISVIIAVIIYLFPNIYLKYVFAAKYITISNKPKILVVWRNGLGEREYAARVIKIAPKLGINAKLVTARNGTNRTIFDKYIAEQPELAARAMRPDKIFIVDRGIAHISGYNNYLLLDQQIDKYITKDKSGYHFVDTDYYKFTGLLPCFKEIDILRATFERYGKRFIGFTAFPTVYATNFKPKSPEKLFFPAGALCDITRSSEKYLDVYRQLDKSGYFAAYGWAESLAFLQNSYRGFIPNDGETLLQLNNQSGVSLILHDAEHLQSGTPSARIFEAIAASTVIISDKHQFIIDNFGDNALYIDVAKDSNTIFQQIDEHMQWLKAHPQEARNMAENCHQIFLAKFTLEEQLQQLVAAQ